MFPRDYTLAHHGSSTQLALIYKIPILAPARPEKHIPVHFKKVEHLLTFFSYLSNDHTLWLTISLAGFTSLRNSNQLLLNWVTNISQSNQTFSSSLAGLFMASRADPPSVIHFYEKFPQFLLLEKKIYRRVTPAPSTTKFLSLFLSSDVPKTCESQPLPGRGPFIAQPTTSKDFCEPSSSPKYGRFK